METSKKSSAGSKKFFLIILLIALILSISFLVFTLFLLKSQYILNIIEIALERSLDKQVKISSISISKGPGIIIKDLMIMEQEEGKPLLILPQIKIDLSLHGLRNREIDSLSIDKPLLFLSTWKGEEDEPQNVRSLIPLSLKNGSIHDGKVTFVLGSDSTITVSNINLLFAGLPDKMAKIEGSAFLPDFNSNISLIAGVDMEQLGIERGHLKVSQIELKNISKKGLPFFEKRVIGGSVSLSAKLLKAVGGLQVELEAPFRNLRLNIGSGDKLLENVSGKLSASLLTSSDNQFVSIKAEIAAQVELMGQESLNKVTLNAAYDVGNKEFFISETTLSSSLLGSLKVKGSLKNFPSSESEYAATIRLHKISLTNIDKYLLTQSANVSKKFSFNGIGDGIVRINGYLGEKLKWKTDFSINHPSINFEKILVRSEDKPLRFISQGVYDLKEDLLIIESLEAEIQELSTLIAQGVLKGISLANPELDIAVTVEEVSLDGISSILYKPSADWLETIDIDGVGKTDLIITGNVNALSIKGNLYVIGNRIRRKGVELNGFRAKVPVRYDKYGLTIINSVINVESLSLNSKSDGFSYSLKDFDFVIPLLEYDDSVINLEGFELNADKVIINKNKKEIFHDERIVLKGGLAANLEGGTVELSDVSVNTGVLKGITGNMSLQFGDLTTVNGTVEYTDIQLDKVWAGLQNVSNNVKGYAVNGRGNLFATFKMIIPEDSLPHLTSNTEFRITEGEFSSSDSTIMGEGIDLQLSGSIEFSLPVEKAKFNLGLDATGFELLYGRFYGDFIEKDLKVTVKGEYNTKSGSLTLSESELSLSEIGDLFVSGTVSNLLASPVIEADIKLPKLVNDRAYNFFIKETFQESFPALTRLQMNGTTSMEISLKASQDKVKARGEIGISEMNIFSESPNISIEGVNLLLPVDISYPAIPLLEKSDEKPEFGSLAISDARWNAMRMNDLVISPTIWNNDLIFKDNIILPIFGGKTILRKPYYDEILSPERNLFLSIDIEDIDFEDVSVALGMPKFGGTISGTIPEVSFFKSSLVTEGEIILNLFGGKMHVNGISISNVFSPIASLKSSIKIRDIDLSKVTETFEFGHISGILEGFIKDLTITNGQAESFTAHIETVKRKGISREISVEALENISVIGSGSSASILNKGIYSFFKKYRYNKIGFRGGLRNDNFLLLGVMVEGNRSYLVKGTLLPPSVNVISYTQNVSFSEMVNRLKRVNLIEKGDTMKTD